MKNYLEYLNRKQTTKDYNLNDLNYIIETCEKLEKSDYRHNYTIIVKDLKNIIKNFNEFNGFQINKVTIKITNQLNNLI